MATKNIRFSSIFEDLVKSLKETWEEVKKSMSLGLKEMLDRVTKEPDLAAVRVPITSMNWEQAAWYTLRNEVVLSDDVGIHQKSSEEVLLIQLPVTIIKKGDSMKKLVNEEILLMEGSFVVGVDFIFPSRRGAVGKFLEIRANRVLLKGESCISRLIPRASKTPRRNPSEEIKKFINDLTLTTTEEMEIQFDEKNKNIFWMVIQGDRGNYHVLINDGNVVIYIGPDKAYVKDPDRTLVRVGKVSRNGESRLEIHVNGNDC